MVGGALGVATVTQTGVSSIPIVGWVIGGAISMFGMDQGAEIGGQMAVDFADWMKKLIQEKNDGNLWWNGMKVLEDENLLREVVGDDKE